MDVSLDSRPNPPGTAAPTCSERPKAALTTTTWSPRFELTATDWLRQGRWLGAIGRASGWWIGDWVRYGNARYGDRYGPAARVTGYDVQTLMNMVYVAGRFGSSRRRESLSYSHHAELASLPPEDQELWLDRAQAGALSVRSLRCELRQVRRRVATRTAQSEDDTGPGSAPAAAVRLNASGLVLAATRARPRHDSSRVADTRSVGYANPPSTSASPSYLQDAPFRNGS